MLCNFEEFSLLHQPLKIDSMHEEKIQHVVIDEVWNSRRHCCSLKSRSGLLPFVEILDQWQHILFWTKFACLILVGMQCYCCCLSSQEVHSVDLSAQSWWLDEGKEAGWWSHPNLANFGPKNSLKSSYRKPFRHKIYIRTVRSYLVIGLVKGL